VHDPEACQRLFSAEHDARTAGPDRGLRTARTAGETHGNADACFDDEEGA
jgi:hypothetical protein